MKISLTARCIVPSSEGQLRCYPVSVPTSPGDAASLALELVDGAAHGGGEGAGWKASNGMRFRAEMVEWRDWG